MEKYTWRQLTPFKSMTYTQQFLKQCYEQQNQEDALAKSYRNSYPMSYYLDYGEKYYSQAEIAPLEIKPVLLFYGLVQLLKGCLLTIHPDYPENADVLAHGVSARKRKKQDYIFFDDVITIQKKGLVSVLVEHLFNLQPLEGNKLSMNHLLLRIPELRGLFERMKQRRVSYPVHFESTTFTVSAHILDDLHMTERRFSTYLNQHGLKGSILNQENKKNIILFEMNKLPKILSHHPLMYDYDGKFYLPNQKELYESLPELLVHYLLLYNLSMISRYETEWWNDLFHQKASYDLPFITEFLSVTEYKAPFYIMTYLINKEKELKDF